MKVHRPCRLFAVDLDGTLLDHNGRPHAADLQALQALRARGVAVSFATGRLYGGVIHASQAIGLQGPLACADGSHIVDAETGDDHAHHAVEADTLGWLRDAFRRHKVAGFLLDRDRVIHDQRGAPFLGYVSIWTERFLLHEGATEHPSWEGEVTGMVGVGLEDQIRPLHEALATAGGHRIQAWSFPVTRPFVVEGFERLWGLVIRAPGPTKGTAVQWLADHHGCSPEEVIVVGDWHNDVPMFQKAGRSFAMGQAPDDVKAVATDILLATAATGGGIAEAARRAGLLP